MAPRLLSRGLPQQPQHPTQVAALKDTTRRGEGEGQETHTVKCFLVPGAVPRRWRKTTVVSALPPSPSLDGSLRGWVIVLIFILK